MKRKDFRLKRNWLGQLILQVRKVTYHYECVEGEGYYRKWEVERWRRATREEAAALEIAVI